MTPNVGDIHMRNGQLNGLMSGCCRHSDTEMWDALEAVQMKYYVRLLPGGLDALVTEGGGNLSVSVTGSKAVGVFGSCIKYVNRH